METNLEDLATKWHNPLNFYDKLIIILFHRSHSNIKYYYSLY